MIIPTSTKENISGTVHIDFHLDEAREVVLDFQNTPETLQRIESKGEPISYQFVNQHIIVPKTHTQSGKNRLTIDFIASNQALNRSEDFMYTLFVPDRASTAFPCFDQPDIKALFYLTLDIPNSWTALSNGPLIHQIEHKDRKTLHFSEDKPISSYLFAFAAGEFDKVSFSHNQREINIFHRETNQEVLRYNLDRIIGHHIESLEWMEAYTGIDYPFAKFDIALIPGFQYSGMEHPGAIWYRDARLLLEPGAPVTSKLAKANLIAHETAHMWFGNLVTMKWFDDVWLKEVFAGQMADKMVHPQFPDINHNLSFVLNHYPRARSVDRTQGTHPIKQPLENLKLAGTLYGSIIYNKAPIVFEHLERLMGTDAFRGAVQEYLQTYRYNNADWDHLVAIFNKHSSSDLDAWSQRWIYETGLPQLSFDDAETQRAFEIMDAFEGFLHAEGSTEALFVRITNMLITETNPQIASLLLGQMQGIFWRFLNDDQRKKYGPKLEDLLWNKTINAPQQVLANYLDAYSYIATSEESLDQMHQILKGVTKIPDYALSEDQQFNLSAQLALRGDARGMEWVNKLQKTTMNSDRARRIAFVKPALSPEAQSRDAFFKTLLSADGRRPEPWVLEAVYYLHHPLRQEQSIAYLAESLRLLPEIQKTGDIFFPLRWMEASFSGHNSKQAAHIAEEYLHNADLHPSLRQKVLQAADMTFRASARMNKQ